jgi:hypothetical protein
MVSVCDTDIDPQDLNIQVKLRRKLAQSFSAATPKPPHFAVN